MPPPLPIAGELRALARLAWPVVLGNLGTMGMGVVDTLMVGRLGAESLAAVAIGATWSFAALIPAMGACSGLDPWFAQAYGAGRPDEAGRALVRGALVLAVMAAPVVALHLVAAPALTALGQPAEVIPDAARYSQILAWTVAPVLGFHLLRHFLQGDGEMRAPAAVVAVANGVNLLANAALIYGWWGAPAMGVAGCAWATVIARSFMFAALVALALPALRRARPRGGIFEVGPTRRMASDALLVAAQSAMEAWAFNAATFLAGRLGALPVAAHAIVMNLASLAFMVPLGVSSAAATRVGNLLGAGARWDRAGWSAVGLGAGLMGVSALLFAGLPGSLVRLYTGEAPVIEMAASMLVVAAAFQIFDGIQVVSFGVLRGAGDVRLPALANAVGYWAIGLPLGAWLAFRTDWGVAGIWVGLTVGLASVAGLLMLRLRQTARRGGSRVQ